MQTIAKTFRPAALPALTLALGACWQSDKPLILASDSVQPVMTGKYEYHEDDGKVVSAELALFPGGGYVATINDNPDAVLALPVNAEWYVVQAGDAEHRSLYGLAHMTQSRVDFFDPPCGDEMESIRGVKVSSGDCEFDNVDALLTAARQQVERGKTGEAGSWLDLESRTSP